MILPPYSADAARYDEGKMVYRRAGRSGVLLPEISLGLWHNFGDEAPLSRSREMLHFAFDNGITHFDLANNYGPSYGSAEQTFGQVMKHSFAPYRDELFISTKAGYDMWPGPYGNWGSRKYLMASLDQSLRRMNLDYVDLFYIHRYDPETPVEETLRALVDIVRSGKALYVGISRWPVDELRKGMAYLDEHECHCLLLQDRINILDRTPNTLASLEAVREAGTGFIAFSPLAQGLLTSRYLSGEIPAGSRAAADKFLHPSSLTPEMLATLRTLNGIAEQRGETLASMALAWVLAQPGVTSVIVGASSTAQLATNLAAAKSAPFTPEQLAAIDAACGKL